MEGLPFDEVVINLRTHLNQTCGIVGWRLVQRLGIPHFPCFATPVLGQPARSLFGMRRTPECFLRLSPQHFAYSDSVRGIIDDRGGGQKSADRRFHPPSEPMRLSVRVAHNVTLVEDRHCKPTLPLRHILTDLLILAGLLVLVSADIFIIWTLLQLTFLQRKSLDQVVLPCAVGADEQMR